MTYWAICHNEDRCHISAGLVVIMCLRVEKVPGRAHVQCGAALFYQTAMTFFVAAIASRRQAQPRAPTTLPRLTTALLCPKHPFIQRQYDTVSCTWIVAPTPATPREEPFEVLSCRRHDPLAIHLREGAQAEPS